jgi:hypothetical protein
MPRLSVLWVSLLLLLVDVGRTGTAAQGMRRCTSGVSPEQSRICDEEALKQAETGSQTTQLDGGWRLVKTRNPDGGASAVSVMHLADTSRSDFAMAGLSLQCGPKDIEIVLVLLEPLPRHTRPAVVITSGTRRWEFEASVTQAGQALVLPQTASALAAGEWQKASELSLQIETNTMPIKGVVPIDGLAGAWRSLSPHCAAK